VTPMHNRVLVVDDEKAIADLIELYLRNEDYCVFKFYNGQDALAFIDGESVDLLAISNCCSYSVAISTLRRNRVASPALSVLAWTLPQ